MSDDEDKTVEEMLEEVDMDAPVTRGEIVELVRNISTDMQSVIDNFNGAIQQIFANQQNFDERIQELEDPTKPRIFIPK